MFCTVKWQFVAYNGRAHSGLLYGLCCILLSPLITGPPTHTVGTSIVLFSVVCGRLSSSVTSDMQHNSPVRDGGPVVSRPVKATPCSREADVSSL